MSRPSTLDLPEHASARRLDTARGSFAVLDAAPAPVGVPPGRSSAGAPGTRGSVLLVPGFTGSAIESAVESAGSPMTHDGAPCR